MMRLGNAIEKGYVFVWLRNEINIFNTIYKIQSTRYEIQDSGGYKCLLEF